MYVFFLLYHTLRIFLTVLEYSTEIIFDKRDTEMEKCNEIHVSNFHYFWN